MAPFIRIRGSFNRSGGELPYTATPAQAGPRPPWPTSRGGRRGDRREQVEGGDGGARSAASYPASIVGDLGPMPTFARKSQRWTVKLLPTCDLTARARRGTSAAMAKQGPSQTWDLRG